MKFIIIIIALSYYKCIAGWREFVTCCCCCFNEPELIDLDINTRDSDDRVKVTKTQEGCMYSYIVEPRDGYAVDRYTSNGLTIFRHKKRKRKESLLILTSIHSNDTVVVGIKYKNWFKYEHIFLYKFRLRWEAMTNDFLLFVIDSLVSGNFTRRELAVSQYVEYIRFRNQQESEFIMSKIRRT